jgi:hypothetical protein
METPSPTPTPGETKQTKGIPLGVFMIILLVIAVVGVASLAGIFYYTRSDKAKLERQLQAMEAQQAQAKVDEKKAAENAKLTLAKNRQDEVLAQVRNATNVLFQLLAETKSLASDAAALKSNDAGRQVALHPDLVAQARRLYENEIPQVVPVDEVVTRLEGVRRVEQQILGAAGTTFEPGADLLVTAQNGGLWAEPEKRKAAQARTLLAGLISESKVKVTGGALTPSSPTLEEAIRRLNQSEVAARQEAIVKKTTEAKAEGTAALAQAEAQRVLDQAKAEAKRVIDEAAEIKAQAERDSLQRKAQTTLENTRATVAAKETLDEATRTKLRQRASDPSVQAALAPLITPGFWTPAAGTGPYKVIEKKPMSLSELQAAGALNPDANGLRALVRIACYNRNDRPRWDDIVTHNTAPSGFQRDPARVALAAERQKILIEVAPVLVEMKLLEP